MTPRMRRFAELIIEGTNPSRAYVEAGYAARNPKTVANEAYKLMCRPDISAMVEEGKTEAARRASWSRELALERLEAVNAKAFEAVMAGDLASRGAAGTFMASLDRLDALVGVHEVDADEAQLERAREIICSITTAVERDAGDAGVEVAVEVKGNEEE